MASSHSRGFGVASIPSCPGLTAPGCTLKDAGTRPPLVGSAMTHRRVTETIATTTAVRLAIGLSASRHKLKSERRPTTS